MDSSKKSPKIAVSNESSDTESPCSACKLNINWTNAEHFDLTTELDTQYDDPTLDDLCQTSQALSQISVHEDDPDVHSQSARDNFQENGDNVSQELATLDQIKDYSYMHNNLMAELVNGEQYPHLPEADEDVDFSLRYSSIRESDEGEVLHTRMDSEVIEPIPEKRAKFCGDSLLEKGSNLRSDDCGKVRDTWEMAFPSEGELQKIDQTVRQLTQQNLRNVLKSRKEEMPKVMEVDVNEMKESLSRRKRKFQDLVNNVYEATCYLDKVRGLLTSSSSSDPVTIPRPQKSNGYDQHFDFPDRSRYSKLDIMIEPAGAKKDDSREHLKMQSNASVNSERNKKSTPNKPSVTGVTLKPSCIKPLTKRIEISLPNRFKKHPLKEICSPNKENIPGGVSNTSLDGDSISDSGSMYEYNPLIRARKHTK